MTIQLFERTAGLLPLWRSYWKDIIHVAVSILLFFWAELSAVFSKASSHIHLYDTSIGVRPFLFINTTLETEEVSLTDISLLISILRLSFGILNGRSLAIWSLWGAYKSRGESSHGLLGLSTQIGIISISLSNFTKTGYCKVKFQRLVERGMNIIIIKSNKLVYDIDYWLRSALFLCHSWIYLRQVLDS